MSVKRYFDGVKIGKYIFKFPKKRKKYVFQLGITQAVFVRIVGFLVVSEGFLRLFSGRSEIPPDALFGRGDGGVIMEFCLVRV